jgi:hypothetical protein
MKHLKHLEWHYYFPFKNTQKKNPLFSNFHLFRLAAFFILTREYSTHEYSFLNTKVEFPLKFMGFFLKILCRHFLPGGFLR